MDYKNNDVEKMFLKVVEKQEDRAKEVLLDIDNAIQNQDKTGKQSRFNP